MKWKIQNANPIPDRRAAYVGSGHTKNPTGRDEVADFNLSLSDDSAYDRERPMTRTSGCDWAAEIVSRIESFRSLTEDWDGYGAAPIKADVLIAASHWIKHVACTSFVVAPSVVATRTGGVLVSWRNGPHRLEVQYVSRDAASFTYLNVRSGAHEKGALFTDSDDTRFWTLLNTHFAS